MSHVAFDQFTRMFREGEFEEITLSCGELLSLVRGAPPENWRPVDDGFYLVVGGEEMFYAKQYTEDDQIHLKRKDRQWLKQGRDQAATRVATGTGAAGGRPERERSELTPLERAGFLAHARSLRFARLLENTLSFLRKILKDRRAHVSLSGGKDSMLSLRLVREAVGDSPAVHLDSGGEHPASWPHVRSLGNIHRYLPRITYPEILRATYGDGHTVSSAELMRYIMDEPSSRAHEDLDTDSYVIGLREEESSGRKWTGISHGPVYTPKAGGAVRISPLLRWTWKDVWAATVLLSIPIHPAYFERSEGQSLKRSRVGVLTDLASDHTPATLSEFAAANPAAYARLKSSAKEAPWPI